jgi:hypothetical protein
LNASLSSKSSRAGRAEQRLRLLQKLQINSQSDIAEAAA